MRQNRTVFPNLYLAIVMVLLYLPIAIVVIYSFNSGRNSTIWAGFSLSWYKELFRDRSMLQALRNSVFLGVSSSAAAAVIGTLGATGSFTAVLKSRSDLSSAKRLLAMNRSVEFLATLPIMMPEIILGMVFLAFFALIGLPFGMTTLIIAHTAFCIPYVFLMVKARLSGLDPQFTEAAKDLGASEFRAFWDITLPLCLPAIISGMLLSFAMSFDDVIVSVFVTGVNTNTLPIKIYSQIKTGVSPKTNALCSLLFLLTVGLGLLSFRIGFRNSNTRKKI
jgi:spermidine/putrescine transport system permease protein